MQTSVAIKDLAIEFGAVKVIEKLDLNVGRGEFVVLLGPSGCGKSTLLNAIAGLIDIVDGEVWISDKNVTWSEPKDRGIGMVFQSYALYPQMSVRQNLSFGLKVAGLPREETERRVGKAASMLQLEALLDRKPSELSGGQRQRVAIGRALVRNVDVFLFDEPLSNLDAKLRNELRVEIKRLHQELGNTMIYVTHDQIEALTLADRIAVMRKGVIEQFATPHEIYHRPANTFIAGFIGSPTMNFLKGALERTGDTLTFIGTAEARFDVSSHANIASHAGKPVILGIRPEHMVLGPATDTRMHTGRATVKVVEPMGADTVVWVDFGGDLRGMRIAGDPTVAPGDTVDFHFPPERVSFFEAENGVRI